MTLPARDEKWHEERRTGLGGSDAPVVVLGEYYGKTDHDLFLEKTGAIAPDDYDSPDIRRGLRQEPIAAQVYEEISGYKVRRVKKILRHKERPYILANIDREILGLDGAPLEIKCPRAMTFRKYQMEGIPEGIQIQGAHYLAVKGKGQVIFAIFCAELDEMLIVPVERDQELINLILDKESEFWSYVEAGEFPELPAPKPLDLLPIGGELVKVDTAEWVKAAAAFWTARGIKEEAIALEDEAKAKIIKLMGEHDVVEGAGLRVYHREQAGRKSFDKKALQAAHPEINIDDFYKVGEPFRSFRPYRIKE